MYLTAVQLCGVPFTLVKAPNQTESGGQEQSQK